MIPWLAALAAVLNGCGEASESTVEDRAQPVEVATVEAATVTSTVAATGTLQSPRTVEIRSEAIGLVESVSFEEGSLVRSGQRLVTLDAAKLSRQLEAQRAALEAAEAREELAGQIHHRVTTLHERGSASAEELDRSAAALRQARAEGRRIAAEIGLVEERLEDTAIVAPATGRLAERLVDPGDFLDVGDPVAVLYTIDPLEIAFAVPERSTARIVRGQEVAASVPAFPDREFGGEVGYISPVVDEGTRSFLVKALIANPDGSLKPGTFATARVVTERREGVPVVPEEALVSTRTGLIAFVVSDGAAVRREVEIGLREPGRVEIRSGLEVGETVVRTGQMNLSDGAAVRVVGGGPDARSGPEPGS
ncbi:MAG TPA: efflux RND transporter periplasmic adaptor subunit [Chondromyces sp.]|nr:efflux RND transporter periplasmic adaptor subunit [Chondromyces sp.]